MGNKSAGIKALAWAAGKQSSALALAVYNTLDLSLNPEEDISQGGDVHTGSSIQGDIAPGGRRGVADWRSELRGPNISGQPPPEGALLRAASFSETEVAEITGTATAGTGTVTLVVAGETFVTKGVERGTWINNSTQTKYCFVLEVVNETTITTTVLRNFAGVTANWAVDDAFTIEHVFAYELSDVNTAKNLIADGGNLDPIDLVHWMDGLQTKIIGAVLRVAFDFSARNFPMMEFDAVGQLEAGVASFTSSGETEEDLNTFVRGADPLGLGAAGWEINVSGSPLANQVAYALRYDLGTLFHDGEGFNGLLGTEQSAITGFEPIIQMVVEVPSALADANFKNLCLNRTILWFSFAHGVETGFPWFVSYAARIDRIPQIQTRGGKALYLLELSQERGTGSGTTPFPLRLVNSGSV